MDKKIRHQLRIKKIQLMKHPTILMNIIDFDLFKKKLESNVVNFKLGEVPTYENIPIKTSDFVEIGTVIIYDNIFKEFMPIT